MLVLSIEFGPVCLSHMAQDTCMIVFKPETILVAMLKRKTFGD